MKPWLLMTKEERLDRVKQYKDYITNSIRTGYCDEGLEIMLRSPTEAEARLELLVWQWRHKEKSNG